MANHSETEINAITECIIGCCMDVHREIGPGLLESIYEECLGLAFQEAGLSFERQGAIPVVFRNHTIEQAFRFDFRVQGQVIVEVKAVETLHPVHKAQVINYLRLTGNPVGLLVNFNVPLLKQGLHRVINPQRKII